jgi:hypothetical protein
MVRLPRQSSMDGVVEQDADDRARSKICIVWSDGSDCV